MVNTVFFRLCTSVSLPCQPLVISFPNGDVHGQGSMFGDRYNFKCNSPFTLIGKEEIVCGKDGLWSGKLPFCQISKLKMEHMIALADI